MPDWRDPARVTLEIETSALLFETSTLHYSFITPRTSNDYVRPLLFRTLYPPRRLACLKKQNKARVSKTPVASQLKRTEGMASRVTVIPRTYDETRLYNIDQTPPRKSSRTKRTLKTSTAAFKA